VFNPIDLSMWQGGSREEARARLGIPPGARVVVWHGRIDYRRKGLDVLLDAWELVLRDRVGRDLRLLIIGAGNDSDDLRRRLSTGGVPATTWVDEYINDRSRIRDLLKSADIYAFPSRHEGFPVAPIEAMACGLPLVAADAPGIPDILEGGEAAGGLVVGRGDVPAFASALGLLIDNPRRCEELGRRARRRAESLFSLPAVGAQLRQFLNPLE
jgi:starch synthase